MRFANNAQKNALKKLEKLGIRTMADLDERRDPTKESRSNALARLVGEDGAMWILNDLAAVQCNPHPKGSRPRRRRRLMRMCSWSMMTNFPEALGIWLWPAVCGCE